MTITVTVNGTKYVRDVEPRMLLAYFLRESLGLTGTHVGCDSSHCGVCVVVLDGERAVKSCGYCTPGMLMTSYVLLGKNPHPSEAEIRDGLSGNLCRCTGYQNIVKAVEQAAATIGAEAAAPVPEPVAS